MPPLGPPYSSPQAGPPPPPAFPAAPPEDWRQLDRMEPPPPPGVVPEEGRGGARKPLLVGLATFVVVLLVAAAVAALTDDDDEPAARTPIEQSTDQLTDELTDEATDEATDDVTDPTSDESPIDQAIEDIMAFVEQERGLLFKHDPVVELLDDAEFEAELLEDFEAEEAPYLVEDQQVLTALGLLEPGTELAAEFRTLLGAGVVGFYDTENGRLVVRGTEPTPYVRSVIAHELVHALDDQHFELFRPALDNVDDETGSGFTALVEGNARRIEDAYVETFSDEEREEYNQAQFDLLLDHPELLGVPEVLLELIDAPYSEGPLLVDAILDAGGQARLDAAFAAPPVSWEQVREPERFLAGELPLPIAEPVVDPTIPIDHRGVLGVLLLESVLDEELGGDRLDAAITGWGADRYVTWTDAQGHSCIRVSVAGDTANDTAELDAAIREWAAGATATVETAPGAPVTLTRCA